jgi:hypothetical protein
MADNTSSRIDGPTPAGGAYAVAYFRDAAGNPAEKDRAATLEVCEYDADGRCIHRTYAAVNAAAP